MMLLMIIYLLFTLIIVSNIISVYNHQLRSYYCSNHLDQHIRYLKWLMVH